MAETQGVEKPATRNEPIAAPSVTESSTPKWPELSEEHPLRKLQVKLPSLLAKANGYNEIWGVQLSSGVPVTEGGDAAAKQDTIPFTTTLILQKLLRANVNDVEKAASQLVSTLKWRKDFDVQRLLEEERTDTAGFEAEKFAGLGFISLINRKGAPGEKEVVTWNIYGAVNDKKKTFGDVEEFLRWRVCLMEKSLVHLNLAAATKPIPDYNEGPDPYQTVQVHDYLNISFLRMDPAVKAASTRVISLFQAHYPELLSRKFFVNVPTVMSWLFSFMKNFMAAETARKLSMLSDPASLATELGEDVPSAYGGKGKALEEGGDGVKFSSKETTATTTTTTVTAIS